MKESSRTDVLRRRSRLALCLSAGVLCLALSGCTITQMGTPATRPVTVGVTTKHQVYERLGIPSDITYTDTDTILIYRMQHGKGVALGARAYIVQLLYLGHRHVGTDVFSVRIGADGKVASVSRFRGSDLISYGLWPFGD